MNRSLAFVPGRLAAAAALAALLAAPLPTLAQEAKPAAKPPRALST